MMTLSPSRQPEAAFPMMIGVVTSPLLAPCHQNVLNELARQLNTRGALMLLLPADTGQTLTAQLTQAAPLGLRGLLVLSDGVSDRQWDEALAASSLPVIRPDAEPDVQHDARRAGEEMGRLLLAEGHQRFGSLQSHPGRSPQMQGYHASLMTANHTLAAELLADGSDREQAYQAVTRYLKQTRAAERIQALFCESDLLAFGVMQAIRDFGQGAHIAVAGFGDVDEARSSTWHLTTWADNIGWRISQALNHLLGTVAAEEAEEREGVLKIRHSHFGKQRPGEMSECGCAHRH
ncbi:substrate-binding domain-containing protein [Pantoea sp. USHLN298]|uniref:substrate-binding domain-containing protein n=1 Tax=Pantoea sp. USHLN298 TaxID=3081294 RepID=UPI0030194646